MIIQVENLHKHYKKQHVLRGINMTVGEPQIIALVGPNGSGKTTLLNCMTNLLPFQEGKIELLGKKNTDISVFKDVSYLQDNRILYGDLTGYDHLKFVCSIQQLPADRIRQVTDRVGMTAYMKKRVRNYSLGMKQHLLLAMAILNEPKLLLLDEPLNGLDPSSAITMRNILLELHGEGTTIFLSSHNLDEIDRLTDTIYFMKDGELLKESLHDFSRNEYVITVDESDRAAAVLTQTGLPYTANEDGQIEFLETEAPLQDLLDQLKAGGLTILRIDNRKIGAERRYQELFAEENVR
ncbi:ABC transporter ATP-binding protein [Sporosarcina sp. D27]|uniref:ABC transporter ATP-binding protein n=1 Tax=Sporosarcina sp. D27 TaxID=1382305 RepID=UPI000471941D|nr:ABC transporter ATP-binding protein [Sporosarcina sp. D27]